MTVFNDLVGVVHGILPAIYGTSPVVAAEYFLGSTARWVNATVPTSTGPGLYQQTSSSVAPGIAIVGGSVHGGAQVEAQMAVWYVDDDPVFPDAWWLSSHGVTMGYIAASNFTALATSACRASHYAEAYDPDHETSTPSWMAADMGSGAYPPGSSYASNFGFAGFLRRPGYWASKNGGTYTSATGPAGDTDARCYSSVRTTSGGGSWNPTYWFGGPGGNGALGLCTVDPSCSAGVLNGAATACCDPRCGACGGVGCQSYWDDPVNFTLTGNAACCQGNILASTRQCSNSRAPRKM